MIDDLSARFRLIREKAGFTQAQVAGYLGVDQSYISKFEKGERRLNLHYLGEASVLFGCPPEAMGDSDFPIGTLSIAMRANGVSGDDLKTLATIRKIALNQQFMEQLLEGEDGER